MTLCRKDVNGPSPASSAKRSGLTRPSILIGSCSASSHTPGSTHLKRSTAWGFHDPGRFIARVTSGCSSSGNEARTAKLLRAFIGPVSQDWRKHSKSMPDLLETTSGGPPYSRRMKSGLARSHLLIEAVEPQIDCGRYLTKAIVGDRVEVTADIFW